MVGALVEVATGLGAAVIGAAVGATISARADRRASEEETEARARALTDERLREVEQKIAEIRGEMYGWRSER